MNLYKFSVYVVSVSPTFDATLGKSHQVPRTAFSDISWLAAVRGVMIQIDECSLQLVSNTALLLRPF